MTDRQQLVAQLVRHEGLRLKPYVDTVGKVTIGVGRNLTDVGLSDAEAMQLLDHDIDAAITDLTTFAWFPGLDPIRQRAVVDFRFNVGGGTFRLFPKFIHAMAIADYAAAATELLTSKWATQVGIRAKEIAGLLATGSD
jgi:lysozyme